MAKPQKAGRDYGSGSIYQRADGIWIATIEAGWTQNQKRRRVQVSAKTEAEVRRKLRDKKRALEIAQSASEVSVRETVKSWAEKEWLPMVEREQRPTTYTASCVAVRKWIVPTIGHKRLLDLTPADVRAVGNAQRVAGLSSSSQLRTHSVLMSVLKAAKIEGHPISENVFLVKRPTKAVNTRTDMSVTDAVAVLGVAAETLPHASRVAAALLQGLRQGEALGLTWEQVNLPGNLLTISWQLQPLPYRVRRDTSSGFRIPDGYEARQLRGRWHLVRPKSKSGWRVIPLVPWMSAALAAWQEVAPNSPHDLVWPNLNGEPTDPKVDDAEWYGLQCAAGVGHPREPRWYTIHEARHTTATLLLEAGVDPAVIVAIMGHSSVLTTRGYQHVNTRMSLDAMEKIAARLELA